MFYNSKIAFGLLLNKGDFLITKNIKKVFYTLSVLTFLTSLVSCQCDSPTEPNQSPSIEDQSFRVPNNLSDTRVIGRVVASDPDTSFLDYLIVSNDNDLFDIDKNNGDLIFAFGQSFDPTATNRYVLIVEVSDREFSSSATITIDVVGVPIITNQSFRVPNNLSDMEVIGRVVASDPDTSSLTYSIVSNDNNNLFELVGSNGDLSLADGESFNLAVTSFHFLTVEVSDGEFTSFPATIIIDVGGIPIITNQSFRIPNNLSNIQVIGRVVASDPDTSSLTYNIINNDNDLFEIASNSGDLSLVRGQSFDLTVTNRHVLIVGVSDGEFFSSATITINAGAVPVIANQSFRASNNISDTQVIGRVVASDPDTSSLTYSIVSNDNDLFEIDNNNGDLSLVSGGSFNLGVTNQHILTVEVSDGEFFSSATITIDVTGEMPIITNQSFRVPNNLSDTQVIGRVVASDPDNLPLSYLIVSNDNNLFEINNNGDLSLVSGGDFNLGVINQHILMVEVSDGEFSSSATITIDVLGVPVITNQSFRASNNISDTQIIGRVVASDPDTLSLTYRLITNDNNLFEIASNSGDLSLANGQSFGLTVTSPHVLTIEVSDGEFFSSATIIINVVGVPVIKNQNFTVREDIKVNNVIATVLASDPDTSPLTYRLIINDNNFFEIASNSGDLSLANGQSLDFETTNRHLLTVEVTDGEFFDTATITLDVQDVLLFNVENVFDADGISLALDGAISVTTAEVGGVSYLFVAGSEDDGVSVFAIENGGTLNNVANVTNDGPAGILKLDGSYSVTTAEVGGTSYLFVAGQLDNGVSVFAIENGGTLSNVTNVTDDGILELRGSQSVTTAEVGGLNYLFVAGFSDSGVSVFAIENGGTLSNVTNVTDDGSLTGISELAGASSVTTAEVGGLNYLFVAGFSSSGVSVFAIENGGTLSNVTNVTDEGSLALRGSQSVTTAEVGGVSYLFVAGSEDDGVSVFAFGNGGTLSNVTNIIDDGFEGILKLDGSYSVTTAEVGGTSYLFVAGQVDNGVSVFVIENGGTLSNVANVVDDGFGRILKLNGASSVTTAEVGGESYLFVAGRGDDGVSVFRIDN